MTRFLLFFFVVTLVVSCNSEPKNQAITKEAAKNISIELSEKFIKDINKDLIIEMDTQNTTETYLKFISNDKTGIDFENKGQYVYRLLDCTLTFLDDQPKEGQTLRYEISINSFARHT